VFSKVMLILVSVSLGECKPRRPAPCQPFDGKQALKYVDLEIDHKRSLKVTTDLILRKTICNFLSVFSNNFMLSAAI
jgi:hypothetical protein